MKKNVDINIIDTRFSTVFARDVGLQLRHEESVVADHLDLLVVQHEGKGLLARRQRLHRTHRACVTMIRVQTNTASH